MPGATAKIGIIFALDHGVPVAWGEGKQGLRAEQPGASDEIQCDAAGTAVI
jgi:hypothetical protein